MPAMISIRCASDRLSQSSRQTTRTFAFLQTVERFGQTGSHHLTAGNSLIFDDDLEARRLERLLPQVEVLLFGREPILTLKGLRISRPFPRRPSEAEGYLQSAARCGRHQSGCIRGAACSPGRAHLGPGDLRAECFRLAFEFLAASLMRSRHRSTALLLLRSAVKPSRFMPAVKDSIMAMLERMSSNR